MDVQPLPDLTTLLQNVAYEQRWEVLKPALEVLYHNKTVPEIAEIVKGKYHFDANVPQYRYRFKDWGWKKSLPAKKKEQILDIAQSRQALGKRTAITYGGEPVDLKKLKRHVASSTRPEMSIPSSSNRNTAQQTQILGPYLPFGNRLFVNWNMPFKIAKSNRTHDREQMSPKDFTMNMPSDVQVQTPNPFSPTAYDHSSPTNVPSPLSVVVSARTANSRTRMFLRGSFTDLIQSLNDHEKGIMSEWLYQFWFCSFKNAKSWGHGLSPWTAESLQFDEYAEAQSYRSPRSPFAMLHSTRDDASGQPRVHLPHSPSVLCHWSIHVTAVAYDNNITNQAYDLSERDREPPLDQIMRENLLTNDFGSIQSELLPIDLSQIVKATQKSDEVFLEESLAFAIMARNLELVETLAHKAETAGLDITSLHPLHVATSYLDGGKTCCNILRFLIYHYMEVLNKQVKDSWTNDYGHTVLDNLMLTILRSHSKAPIGTADSNLKHSARYAGSEVDICGRWDADSPCYRTLAASGRTQIPNEWKHRFCHTSIQAVCHSIWTIGVSGFQMETSGLFQRICDHCGMRLQLNPLHTLIMTGYELANHSYADEDLFGILACYLCLLATGIDPLASQSISVKALTGQNEGNEGCNHEHLTPHGLLDALSQYTNPDWSDCLKTGWLLLRKISQLAQPGWKAIALDSDCWESFEAVRIKTATCFNVGCDYHGEHPAWSFEHEPILGHLWAIVQTELLNYRRLHDGDQWYSQYFNFDSLLKSLIADEMLDVKYLKKNMMRPYCKHGAFNGQSWFHATREDASNSYYSNMDCWERTSFIPASDREEF